VRVHSITVCPDRVDVVVVVADEKRMSSIAGGEAAVRALELLPDLARHRCVNDEGRSFLEELAETEVPHLFEHIVLELMAHSGSPRSLRGETEWDFRRDGRGVFRVSFEYDDDIVCLGAIKAADRLMGYVLDGGSVPDVVAEAGRLKLLRSLPPAQPAC
jgi:hypothetical protein